MSGATVIIILISVKLLRISVLDIGVLAVLETLVDDEQQVGDRVLVLAVQCNELDQTENECK